MPNSSTGGYLPLTKDSFNINHIIHDWITGIAQIDNTLVRPMYQINPPTSPSSGINWIAFNVAQNDAKGFAYQDLDALDNYAFERHSQLTLLVSFYGTNAYQNAIEFKNAIEIVQNWETLRTYGFAFSGSGKIIKVPELFNLRWIDRYNIEIVINQGATYTADILSIESTSYQLRYEV